MSCGLLAPTHSLAHSGVRIVVVPLARPNAPVEHGSPLELPLDVLSTPAEAIAGILKSGVVINQQQVRAREAIVLMSDINEGSVYLPAGTIMSRVLIKIPFRQNAPDEVMWCDSRPESKLSHSLFFDDRVLCLRDRQGDGKLDLIDSAIPASPFSNLSLGWMSLKPSTPLATPATYRVATEAERPTTKIGYRLCASDGDGARIPYHFTSVIFQPNYGWIGAPFFCPFGDWPDPTDKSLVQVDHIRIRTHDEGGSTSYQVLTQIDSGPIDSFVSNTPIRTIGQPDPALIKKLEAESAKPFVVLGLPEGLEEGLHKHGDLIAAVPVAHGVTGVLKNDVTRPGLLGGERIAAGQYVFGVPMHTAAGDQITWCAPRVASDSGSVDTVCFAPEGGGYRWLPVGGTLMPLRYEIFNYTSFAVGVSIERKPASLGEPMKLAYVFNHWAVITSQGQKIVAAVIDVETRTRGSKTRIGWLLVEAGPDGAFRFPILNGLVTLKPKGVAGTEAPVPPSQNAEPGSAETYLAALDKDQALLSVVPPTRTEGALLLFGPVTVGIGAPLPAILPPPDPHLLNSTR